MPANSIQLVPIPSDGGGASEFLFITGVQFRDGNSGRIRFNGKPIQLARDEHFDIEATEVVTEQFHFPLFYLTRFLEANDFVVEGKVTPGVWMEASTLATTE